MSFWESTGLLHQHRILIRRWLDSSPPNGSSIPPAYQEGTLDDALFGYAAIWGDQENVGLIVDFEFQGEISISGRWTHWPAVLPGYGCHTSHGVFVREDVAEVLKKSDLSGFELSPMECNDWTWNQVYFRRRPQYLGLRGTPHLEQCVEVYDRKSGGSSADYLLTADSMESPDLAPLMAENQWRLRSGQKSRFSFVGRPILDSWDGTTDFVDGFCSKAFVDMVQEQDWDQFTFMIPKQRVFAWHYG